MAYFDVFENGFIGATHLEEWIVVASFRESNSSDGICAKVIFTFYCFGFKSIGKIEQGSHMGQDWWQGSLYIARYYYLLLYRIVIT